RRPSMSPAIASGWRPSCIIAAVDNRLPSSICFSSASSGGGAAVTTPAFPARAAGGRPAPRACCHGKAASATARASASHHGNGDRNDKGTNARRNTFPPGSGSPHLLPLFLFPAGGAAGVVELDRPVAQLDARGAAAEHHVVHLADVQELGDLVSELVSG